MFLWRLSVNNLKAMLQKPVSFFQRLFFSFEADPRAHHNGQNKNSELKHVLLEYYSAFAITIFQGIVFFTQESMNDMMLIKPAYQEAQERYAMALAMLKHKSAHYNNKEVQSRIERIIKDASVVITASSHIATVSNKTAVSQYDFIIEVMSVQKQCLDLISDLDEQQHVVEFPSPQG